MLRKKVDVIIPCYNDGKYLLECIAAIRAQTYEVSDIYVVNDNSNDKDTLHVLSGLERQNINILHRQLNGGAGAARNTGISHAKAEYLLQIDADDIIKPEFLQQAVDQLNSQSNVGVVSSWLHAFGDYEFTWCPTGGSFRDFLFSNNCCSMALFRRKCWESVGGYDETPHSYEDWDFWLKVTYNGWNVKIIPQFLFNYRLLNRKSNWLNNCVNNHQNLFNSIVSRNIHIYEKYLLEDKPALNIDFLTTHFERAKIKEIYGELDL